MENRRRDYRHEFAPTRQLRVRLRSMQSNVELQGELINLSTSGMCVYAAGLRAETDESWAITFSLDANSEPLTIAAERVHERNRNRACCGFRFVDGAAETMEEREKVIWKFLLDEQRRRRRLALGT